MECKTPPLFIRGDKVTFMDPEMGKIKGEIFRIAASGNNQQLLIYGTDEKGVPLKAYCHNDEPTLKKEI